MNRKICVVTGTRAEYGLLRWILQELKDSHRAELQILATGAHLSPEFGLTYRDIERDGFSITAKVEMLLSSDTDLGTCKSMGLGLIGMSEAYARLAPDLVLLLGDRFEVLVAASAALILGIPVAHLHGGETTEGAFDEAIRHSVTKMAHLHFVAAPEYRARVIQLGEAPDRVFMVGGLGVDAITRVNLLSRQELEASLEFQLGAKNLLVTFHPVTLEGGQSSHQMAELLRALDQLDDTHLIFSMPNADAGSRDLARQVEGFVAAHPNARAYTSLGQLRYLSCLKWVDGVIGNSSSGLAEAPSLGIGTVNIGDRQRGRLKAASVIDCPPFHRDILDAIHKLYDLSFRQMLPSVRNPYGDGGASRRIVQVLEKFPLDGILKKRFHDLDGVATDLNPEPTPTRPVS
ncbi:UDP-N-acetyl glucosamine 2-epimerase [Geothrix oryzae]|uniref:UDP-N-acetyl glucosamine 2-epimerase n=1 Tax=Geothrix oryzae TaxID=2927975 RepID=A0ABM8DTR0_9BACT|nr:UDP-N-acetylglucosamine 2-epimerase [Geothrix oryzae]BDU70457.1 UDP-N-acetyl glucosamine 2-epimerase [Geothrix oryzae]